MGVRAAPGNSLFTLVRATGGRRTPVSEMVGDRKGQPINDNQQMFDPCMDTSGNSLAGHVKAWVIRCQQPSILIRCHMEAGGE